MQHQVTTGAESADEAVGRSRPQHRRTLRDLALQKALRKRADGVPSYSVPEAAALLSISQEYLYRLIQADLFPALGFGGGQGRYVVPAKAVETILDQAAAAGNCVDVAELGTQWRRTSGGAA